MKLNTVFGWICSSLNNLSSNSFSFLIWIYFYKILEHVILILCNCTHITKNLIYILYFKMVIVICFQQKLLNGQEELEEKGIVNRKRKEENGKSKTFPKSCPSKRWNLGPLWNKIVSISLSICTSTQAWISPQTFGRISLSVVFKVLSNMKRQ